MQAGNENKIRYYSSLTAKQVDWLWEPYIPYGKITVIQGDPGEGKTTLVLNVAALLSRGMPMPGTQDASSYGTVIYQSAEDGVEDTIKPRLVAAGADCSNIAYMDDSEAALTLTDPRIESAIRETNAKLLILDPLQAYLGENNGINSADGVRPALKALASVAERTGCAIIIVGHMNKGNGTKGIYRGLGSIDITAAARSVLLVGRIQNDPSIRVMAQIKNSLAREGASMAFELNENSAVRWIGEYDISAEELLSGGNFNTDDGSKLGIAMGTLKALLKDGAMPCNEIYRHLLKDGISKRTVDAAKKQLDIKSIRKSDGWYWTLQGVWANEQEG